LRPLLVIFSSSKQQVECQPLGERPEKNNKSKQQQKEEEEEEEEEEVERNNPNRFIIISTSAPLIDLN